MKIFDSIFEDELRNINVFIGATINILVIHYSGIKCVFILIHLQKVALTVAHHLE